MREIIDALDAKLQKANEDGMYYFDKCSIQKQQLIDKACEWLRNEADRYYPNTIFGDTKELVQDFKKAMKGGEE